MELLLNLVWLTLVLPAFWMWRHESVYAKNCRDFNRIRPLVLFGCVLMLLFPVVSATDDLHAMRQEMEESSSSKRVVKQAVADKSMARLSIAGGLPALISPVSLGPGDEAWGLVLPVSVFLPQQAHFNERASRAPPFSCLSLCVEFAA
jgi:hypothetical protein